MSRKPFESDLHPRALKGHVGGGRFSKGDGALAPAKDAVAPEAQYSAKNVTTGAAIKGRPPTSPKGARPSTSPQVATKGAPKPPTKDATPPTPKKDESKPRAAAKKVVAALTPKKKRGPRKPKVEKVTTGEQNNAADGEHPDWVIKHSTAGDGKRVRIADDVAALSNPADFEHERNSALDKAQQDAALAQANKIFTEGVTKGPGIRAAIRDVVAEQDGRMGREFDEKTGEPTAVKTAHSTFRKVQDKMDKKGKKAEQVELADAVRFTAVFNEDNYVESVENLRAMLKSEGYDQTEPPPGTKGVAWALGPYRGLNMNFTDASGFTFEVQAHTPKSLETADHDAHKLYEVFRKDGKDFEDLMKDPGPKGAHQMTGIDPEGLTPNAYRALINTKMHDVAETIPIPKGVSIIRKKDAWNDVVKIADKTGNYSSRDASELLRKKPGPRHLDSDDLDTKKMADLLSSRFGSAPATDGSFQAVGKAWYPAAKATIAKWVEGTQYSPEQGAAIVAAFSPNTPWVTNMNVAERYIKGEPLGEVRMDGEESPGTLRLNIARANRVRDMVDVHGKAIEVKNKDGDMVPGDPIEALTGPSPFGTQKIVSFHRNITGDAQAVTVDRHAMRAAMKRLPEETVRAGDEKRMVTVPKGGKAGKAGETKEISVSQQKEAAFGERAKKLLNQKGTYAKTAQAYRIAAERHGVTPAEMQAIVWGQIRNGYG